MNQKRCIKSSDTNIPKIRIRNNRKSMGNLKTKIRPYAALLECWIYKLSSLMDDAKIKRFTEQMVAILCVLTLGGCAATKNIPVNTVEKVVYRDSLIYRIDTVLVEIPKESMRTYTGLLDTLYMETSVAKAWAVADTSMDILNGAIENKHTSIEKEILWKDRIVYRDSIVTKEVPYKVEVVKYKTPNWCWWLLGIAVGMMLYVVYKLLKRFKVL